MKKLILFLIFISYPILIYCQDISIADLIEMNNMTINEYEDFVLEKGYSFYNSEKIYEGDLNEYSKGERINGYLERTISKFTNVTYGKSTALQTIFIEDYIAAKKEIKSLGFNYESSKISEEGARFLNYSKGEHLLSLISFKDDDITIYEISILIVNYY